MKTTKVKELMTNHPFLISPSATLKNASVLMRDINCGILPVGDASGLKGVITDRDIVIRAAAEGKNLKEERVQDYMTPHAYACNEEDFLEDAADKMREHKVSRLLVKNKAGNVTGILSFGGILRREADAVEIAAVVKHATGTGRV